MILFDQNIQKRIKMAMTKRPERDAAWFTPLHKKSASAGAPREKNQTYKDGLSSRLFYKRKPRILRTRGAFLF